MWSQITIMYESKLVPSCSRPTNGHADERAIGELQAAFERFARMCSDGTLRRRSPATIVNYRDALRRLVSLTQICSVRDLDSAVLRAFFREGRGRYAWSTGTIASYRKNLAPFLSWCVSQGLLGVSPLADIPAPAVVRAIPQFYSDNEIKELLYTVSISASTDFERVRNRAIFGTLVLAGLRRGELIGLMVDDVDFDTECLRIRAETSKSRQPRVVKMSREVAALLREYAESRDSRAHRTRAFWINATRGEAFTIHGLKHLTARLSRDGGFRVRLHKMRHTFATKFYQGSRDIASLQQILGHRDVRTTMIYTHVIPDDTRRSLDQNPLGDTFA